MDCVTPVLNLLTSMRVSFPSGVACRSLLCHKLMDLLYVLGLRLGLEMTRRFLHNPMLVLMDAFSTVHAPDDASGSTSVSPGQGVVLCHCRCCVSAGVMSLPVLCHCKCYVAAGVVSLQVLCHFRCYVTASVMLLQVLCHCRCYVTMCVMSL